MTSDTDKKINDTDANRKDMEFGGPLGCFLILLFSHLSPYYFYYCLEFNGSRLAIPSMEMVNTIFEHAMPNKYAITIYLSFIAFQFVLAWVLPGLKVFGAPLKHEGGKKLEYNCNAIQSWYITLITVAVLHVTKIFPLSHLMDYYAPVLTTAIIFSDAVSIFTYFFTIAIGRQHRMTGYFMYDFFMGAVLNPRIGPVDLKMFTEARLSWIVLFLLTASAAVKQFEMLGYITVPMIFMLLAHGLYTNAIMKGEECIPTTWDIFYEKWGWLLIYWNLAGVPFTYCYSSVYILKQGAAIQLSNLYTISLFVALVFAYYVWDTSQSQRNRFRMMLNGTYKPRNTFPQLPWGTLEPLEKVKCMTTKAGSKLLVDGWWAHARKIHYTADIVMSFSWALITGFGSFVPYFYPVFFLGMILHRAHRDIVRCRAKYQKDWDEYCKKVPYLFIPYIF
jgi:delta24(24(1))-sterol reductase